MKKQKRKLLKIVKKVSNNNPLSPEELELLTEFQKNEKENITLQFVKKLGFPLAVTIGILLASFSSYFEQFAKELPDWTNLPGPALAGLDYIWGFLGEPVGKASILYHLPNIILYSFGIFGVKKLFDAIDRKTWLDRVISAQEKVGVNLKMGVQSYVLKRGHSILFVGKGDYIGMQFALNDSRNNSITVSEIKPPYSNIWNSYDVNTGYEDLEAVLRRSDAKTCGEYVFFPVKDDQVFLPSPTAYDLPPHKLDILCQDIRKIEKNNNWKQKRIIVVGDKYHKSIVYSEDDNGRIHNSKDVVSIDSISKKHNGITVIDPTDVVLNKIIDIAKGRRIVFRATEEGLKEYKTRFYKRLGKLGYKPLRKRGILTIGYDLFEDQTEQQTLARTVNDYFPVVLSKTVSDALLRNGYNKKEFLYVPDLVLKDLSSKASEQ